MSQPESFFNIFFKRLDKAHLRLCSYLENPSEENIHDVRISIRRLEAAYSVLPKSSKTKKSEKLITMYGDFFSLNNTVRDHDIILQKLELYGYDSESKISMITNRRKLKKLLKAIALADTIPGTKKPKLKRPKNSTNSKLQKRTLALVKKFSIYVLVVTKDESRVEELHSMRKIVKKLRYVLELYPKGTHDKLIANMKFLQCLLGDIHDCDVFIWYLEKNKKEYIGMSQIIASEKEKRSTIYQKLVLGLDSFKSQS